MNILDKIAKGSSINIGEAALYSLVAILLVFIALIIIIIVMELVFKGEGYFTKKYKKYKEDKNIDDEYMDEEDFEKKIEVDLNDEDAQVAMIVASIDYRNEIKKDVKVVSIRRIED